MWSKPSWRALKVRAIERGEKAGSFPRGGGQGVMTVDYWAREEGWAGSRSNPLQEWSAAPCYWSPVQGDRRGKGGRSVRGTFSGWPLGFSLLTCG